MITFETQLKKLKYLVLKEVAKMTLENRLNKEELEKVPFEIIQGDKAEYRCCVYKERAIVYERAKLAIGCLPNGQMADEFVNVEKDDQIIYVIDAACDKCPINRFVVTEACRGCIQHKCMEVCPAGAITRAAGRAYINHETCKECGLCKEVCPYNAVAEVMRPCRRVCPTGALQMNPEDSKATINKEECVNCGACMGACPFGAISDKSFIVDVTRALMEKKKIYAVVAPSITGQFGPKVSVGQVKSAFKEMGFEDMIEAACGADAVAVHEGNEFIERMENGDKYMTNSCCSGFLNYIEKKFPDQIERASSTVSPMIAVGRMIKNVDKDSVVVFVGPCTAKKNEIKRDSIKDAVDYVMTFEEITALMGAFDIDPEKCEALEINDASSFGRGFAQGGGVIAAIQNYIKNKEEKIEFKPLRVSGPDEIKRAMIMAKVGRLSGNFIEGMMCEGGCIGGPAAMVPIIKSRAQLTKFSKESTKKDVLDNENLKKYEGLNLER
ncbi:ferredoxin hydrogenase large subunit [Clostridium tetanomorphum]|uniref:4Fe-4S binding protein n=1 Tax=Clostridium tetanomorphum TaxID=1553 RepID=A0A923EEN5_CLOTT|nr:4Fe-4S dicluster domain-containing protein [Clostridium tetanomorphum]KAJ51638.1 periplasmic [Fe] hydrogenase 1 [Clostridium tetanomorphum DSM 665]KAJ53645.1 periplasmic [Fe] hydrogenase 1 [Clostridium tetanomorphum DSM 665]MBC2399648.1 4Fe-4S binding protein [Clostridium tetanomorphum]MBP1866232.1 ferredoxin hydrogenase large subunit [Clostridium tetanomorphum]NRS86024.1 ferredoxin hydrogenase large subunit [Clostridium tetanomorphum]